jgi:hypothetical protein
MKKTYLFLFTLLFYSNLFSQTVEKSKKELNSKNEEKNETHSESRSSNNQRSNNLDVDDTILGLEILGYLTYGVFKYGLIGDYNNEDHLHYNLNKHPFSEKGKGNYSETDSIGGNNFRLDIEDHYISGGNLFSGNHLDVKIRPSKYFYFKTDYYQLYEYNTFTKQKDGIWLYYFNLAYDRIRFDDFNLGWTIGASYVANDVEKTGFSYGINAEYFLNKKMSLSVDSKWSKINSFPVNSLELKGKYFRKNYFASLGFERLKIGTPVYNLIGIGGGIYF